MVQAQRAPQAILIQVVCGELSSRDLQSGCALESPGELLKRPMLKLCPRWNQNFGNGSQAAGFLKAPYVVTTHIQMWEPGLERVEEWSGDRQTALHLGMIWVLVKMQIWIQQCWDQGPEILHCGQASRWYQCCCILRSMGSHRANPGFFKNVSFVYKITFSNSSQTVSELLRCFIQIQMVSLTTGDLESLIMMLVAIHMCRAFHIQYHLI